MKTRILLSAFATLAVFAACQETEALKPEVSPKGHTVQIVASLSEQTKTTLSQDGEGKYKCSWEKGDVIYVLERVRAVSSDPTEEDEVFTSFFVASDPLEEGGETAVFSVTFEPFYWEDDEEYLSKHTFTYTYLASTINPYGLYEDYETGEDFFYLMINREQTIHSEGYGTANDMLVSKWSVYEDERPDEAALREIYEETGITQIKQVGDLFDVSCCLNPGSEKKQEPKHYHFDINFLFLTDDHNFTISDESTEIKWVTIDQAKQLADPQDHAMLRMIDKYEDFIKSKYMVKSSQ